MIYAPTNSETAQILAIDAEQGLIGSLMLFPDSFGGSAAATLRPDHFLEPAHAAIFEAMLLCHRAGRRCSMQDVRQAVGGQNLVSEISPGVDLAAYLGRLVSEGATSQTPADYARTVKAHWLIRQLGAAVNVAGAHGLPEARVQQVFDAIDALRSEAADSEPTRAEIGEIAYEVVKRSSAIARGELDEPGVTTGILTLDEAILGLRPGELVVIAGRPGMGKTSVGTAIACKASAIRRTGRRAGVLYFALELGAEAVGARCLADLAYVPHLSPTHSAIRAGRLTDKEVELLVQAQCELNELDLVAGRLTDKEVELLVQAQCELNELDLVIDHRSSITIGEIEATCRAVKRRLEREGRKLGVVIIDYLKQVRATERYRGQRVYEIGEITAGLRDMGKRLGLCVVLLAQLNRSVESRESKRPTLGDLRESGDIENDADVVLLLYREAYYLARAAREAEPAEAEALKARLQAAEHDLEVIIAKNRNGEGERALPLFCDIGRSVVAATAWNDR